MAGADVAAPKAQPKKGAKKHKTKKRVAVRIDMTPMVDVAFLLLIFFMVTTVFRTPQALEINLPPDNDTPAQIAESKVLQLRVLGDDRIFWKRGAKEDPWSRTVAASMKDVLKPLAGNSELVVLIKIDREARFDNMVTIIDQLDIAKLGRFSILELPEKEKAEVVNL